MRLEAPGADLVKRARTLGMASVDDARAPEIARALGVPVHELVQAFHSAFAGTTTSTLMALKPAGTGSTAKAGPLALRTASLSTARWDPVKRLPADLQARLSPTDRAKVDAAVMALQDAVKAKNLTFIPVFGYLSLRTHNFAELGKASQSDVVAGVDTVEARLPGFEVGVVASTMFRGTPQHPGVVAGLAHKPDGETPGTILKVPLARAEELLAVLIARELFAESDLVTMPERSNLMYMPEVHTAVQPDGTTLPAFVFVTNTEGDKALDHNDAFGDEQGLTVERLAYLLAAQGGFVKPDGTTWGGPALDYWEKSYLAIKKKAGEPVCERIAQAVELSRLYPQEEALERILARTDVDGLLMQRALRVLFQGVVVPLDTHRHQKPPDGLVRVPQGKRGEDAERLLLEKARALEAAGVITVDD